MGGEAAASHPELVDDCPRARAVVDDRPVLPDVAGPRTSLLARAKRRSPSPRESVVSIHTSGPRRPVGRLIEAISVVCGDPDIGRLVWVRCTERDDGLEVQA